MITNVRIEKKSWIFFMNITLYKYFCQLNLTQSEARMWLLFQCIYLACCECDIWQRGFSAL